MSGYDAAVALYEAFSSGQATFDEASVVHKKYLNDPEYWNGWHDALFKKHGFRVDGKTPLLISSDPSKELWEYARRHYPDGVVLNGKKLEDFSPDTHYVVFVGECRFYVEDYTKRGFQARAMYV